MRERSFMSGLKSTFRKNLEIEEEISQWLHQHFYSTDIFERAVKINESDLQHKGVDVYLQSHTIFKDRREHAVDEKAAMTYVKRDHKESPLPTFAFELNYLKDDQLKEGWVYGDKYTNTEYYHIMWIWADVSKKGQFKYTWQEINQQNITKVKGLFIKKSVIQNYLSELNIRQQNLWVLRSQLQTRKKPIIQLDSFSKVMISHYLKEKPMNIVINAKKLEELASYQYEQLVEQRLDKKESKEDNIYSKTQILVNYNEEKQAKKIAADLRLGIKSIVFARNARELKNKIFAWFNSKEHEYLKSSILLEVTEISENENIQENYCFINGKMNVNDWKQVIENYNWEQYAIEHFNHKENISVTAGAGTGKTRTMVQRLLYLVLHKGLSFEEIGMITFTNDAANQMKERITDVIYARFKLTKLSRYLILLEDINEMKVSTIDSFSRDFIREYDYKLGLGKNTPITSYIYKKVEIIEELMDQFYKKEAQSMLEENNIQEYELVNFIQQLWEQVLSLGIDMNSFKEYQTYRPEDRILRKIVLQAAEKLDEVKKEEGKIDLSDLKFLAQKILAQLETEDLNYSNIKYLFVDEFQDTDNIQIDYISAIHNKLDTKLFIVGDEQQSIYRFRGAEHTAFKRIKKKVNADFEEFRLKMNYRTNKILLDDMNKQFTRFLPDYQPLIAFNNGSNKKIEKIHYELQDHMVLPEKYQELFIQAVEKQDNEVSADAKIAVLCRTNKEVDQLARVLDNNGYKGKYSAAKSGSLFQSDAAKDLVKLMQVLLNPANQMYHLAAANTPYFYTNDLPTDILEKLDHSVNLFSLSQQKLLAELLNKKKHYPFLSILRMLLLPTSSLSDDHGIDFDYSLYHRYLQDQLGTKDNFNKYRNNYFNELNLIIEKISQTFGSESYSLVDIAEWLNLQINTNTVDDMNLKNQETGKIILTTIHKAKGLEYEAVIIPLTHQPIWMRSVGFHLDYHQKEFASNLNKKNIAPGYKAFGSEETKELIAEESRVLYVAMTRAKESLTLFLPKRIQGNSFACLLEGKGR